MKIRTDAGVTDTLGELGAEGLAERDVALLEDAVEELEIQVSIRAMSGYRP